MIATALIVGAGVALQRAGWRVRIFERAPSPRDLGFGLALAPNAMAALRELGVADVVTSQSAEPRRAEARRLDGTVLKRVELPPGALGGPTVIALRPALHGALLAAVGAEAIALDCTATGFTVHGTGVRLQLADGLPAEGDVLIGADGAGSFIRRVLHPQEPPPRSSGLVAVRGVVHGVLHHLGDRDAVYYLGPGVESMLVRASETAIYWFLSMARDLLPVETRDPAAILAAMGPRFDATFRARDRRRPRTCASTSSSIAIRCRSGGQGRSPSWVMLPIRCCPRPAKGRRRPWSMP